MSRFGGPSSKAAVSVQESFHGVIAKPMRLGDARVPRTVSVNLTGSGVKLLGVYYARKLDGEGMDSLIGQSVLVTKAGGRWIIL